MKQLDAGKWLFYCLCGIIPFALWFIGADKGNLFSNYYLTMTTIGKVAGITGLCFFAGNLVLSGRYKILDRIFGGLDKLFLFHRRVGITAFILLTVHVAALSLRMWRDSILPVFLFLVDVSNVPVNYGRLSYTGLLIIILITLFVRLKYERLKGLHMFLGVFLFFGGVHAFLIPSDIASNIPLRAYVLTLVGISLVSYVWRTVLKHFLVRRIACDVVEVNALNASVTEVVIRPRHGKVLFLPGQFMFYKFNQKNFPFEDHPFSLTASTHEGVLKLSAKVVGDFTAKLRELAPGSTALLQGPFGGFTYKKVDNNNLLWIAGGIGITPFISMVRTLRDDAREKDAHILERTVVLVYTVKNQDDLVYGKELEEIAHTYANFTFIPWVTDREGRLTVDDVEKVAPKEGKDIFLCGPKSLITSFSEEYRRRGVPQSRIHFELFTLL